MQCLAKPPTLSKMDHYTSTQRLNSPGPLQTKYSFALSRHSNARRFSVPRCRRVGRVPCPAPHAAARVAFPTRPVWLEPPFPCLVGQEDSLGSTLRVLNPQGPGKTGLSAIHHKLSGKHLGRGRGSGGGGGAEWEPAPWPLGLRVAPSFFIRATKSWSKNSSVQQKGALQPVPLPLKFAPR